MDGASGGAEPALLVAGPTSRRGATSDEQGPLPKGWKWRIATRSQAGWKWCVDMNPRGRRMYYNRDTGEVSLQRPERKTDEPRHGLELVKSTQLDEFCEELEAENAHLKELLADMVRGALTTPRHAVSLGISPVFEQPGEVAAGFATPAKKAILQSVLRSMNDLIVAFDEDGCTRTISHSIEHYFGVSESTISGQKFSTWLLDYKVLVEDIRRCMQSAKEVEGLPIQVKNNEGETFVLSYTVSPLTFSVDGEATPVPSLRDTLPSEPEPEAAGAESNEQPPWQSPASTTPSTLVDCANPELAPNHAPQVRGCVVVFDDITKIQRLGRYFDPAVVTEVIKSGSDTLGGVRQKVTVLFSDIRSFTTISEGMDAPDLVAMLNDYFEHELHPIFDNGGILDKFIGDAIMACFGVPLVSADDGKTDACMSCKCALEQLAALEVFNQIRREKRGPDTETFAIGIGLNTSEVVSGNIGSSKRMEYTVIGDGVNLASRLEGITKTVRHAPAKSARSF
eukprot:COSAG02_NODE_1004_length_15275_cov_11.955917_1_plen_509_part_00